MGMTALCPMHTKPVGVCYTQESIIHSAIRYCKQYTEFSDSWHVQDGKFRAVLMICNHDSVKSRTGCLGEKPTSCH